MTSARAVAAAIPAAVLLFALGCRDEGPARNPFPEGLDTAALVRDRTLFEGRPVRILAFDVAASGAWAIGHEDGLVTTYDPRADRRASFQLDSVEGLPAVINGVGVLPDGRVAIREATRGRLTIHDSDGTERNAWTVSRGRPPHGREAVVVAEDGTLLLGIRPELPPGAPPVAFPRPAYVRSSIVGETLDTLWIGAEVAQECPTLSEGHFRAGWFEDIRARYVPKPLWGVAPDGSLAYGCPARYEFRVRRPHGAVLTVSRSWRPRAVSGRERNDFVASWTVQMNNSGVHDRWEWPAPALPETKPAYQRILPTDDGRIWVWPTQPSRQEPAPPDWPIAGLPSILWTESAAGAFDVFEADGRLRGHVRLPADLPYSGYPNTPDPVIRGDTLWAVTISDSTAYALERFHIAW